MAPLIPERESRDGDGANDLVLQIAILLIAGKPTPEVGDTMTTLCVLLCHAEYCVLVRIQCHWATMLLKVATERLEVSLSALAVHETQLHQPARRIIDKH